MSVTSLVIGDPHFKVSNTRETNAMVEAIVKIAAQKRPDFIVVLGDVLDRHETIHVSPLTRSIKFLAQLRDIAPTYVLIGNHDMKNHRQFLSDEHPFTACKYWESLTIIDTTTTVRIKEHLFTMVPYVPPGMFMDALSKSTNEQRWQESTVIFAHQEFKGCKMGAMISEEGDVWPTNYPYVISGHIHDYQELQGNILYTGTPIQQAFGDEHEKTISYFEFILPSLRNHERIDLNIPRKKIVRLTCAEVPSYVVPDNVELKITIRGMSGEIKAIMKHPNIKMWEKAGHRVNYKDTPIENASSDEIIPRFGLTGDNRFTQSFSNTLRYSQILYNSVAGNPKLGTIFNKIFGSVKTEIKPTTIITLSIKK
jgi:DNA repair exonuclease SbcCD nuclease subunit